MPAGVTECMTLRCPWCGCFHAVAMGVQYNALVANRPPQVVLPESLPTQVRGKSPKGVGVSDGAVGARSGGLPELKEGFDLEALGEEFYRHYIALALERAGGVQTRAAEMLGMSFRSFRYYAKKFNLR